MKAFFQKNTFFEKIVTFGNSNSILAYLDRFSCGFLKHVPREETTLLKKASAAYESVGCPIDTARLLSPQRIIKGKELKKK